MIENNIYIGSQRENSQLYFSLPTLSQHGKCMFQYLKYLIQILFTFLAFVYQNKLIGKLILKILPINSGAGGYPKVNGCI